MLPNFCKCALAALSLLSTVDTIFAGHARFHHASHPRITAQKLAQRAGSTRGVGVGKRAVSVTMGDLQMLQSETVAFQGWIDDWLNASQALDVGTASAQLKQEFTAYQGWIKTWLDAAMGPASAPPLPSSVPVTASSTPASSPVASSASKSSSPAPLAAQPPSTTSESSSTASQPSASASQPSSTDTSLDDTVAQSPADAVKIVKPSTTSSANEGAQLFEAASSPSAADSTSSSGPTSVAVSSTSIAAIPTSSTVIEATPSIIPQQADLPPTPPSTEGSSSDSGTSSSVAVYYGQSAATSQYSLEKVCQSDSVDIVILAFLTDFFGPGGFPKVNFGSACGGQANSKMMAAGATGLMECQTMRDQIQSCQSAGKKVLLSLGGALATSAFPSDDQATKFAGTLVDLFAGGTGVDSALRPFGDVKLDGFDVDNEDHSTTSYSTFVSALRKNLDSDTSKKYFISAAPQCPRPDASIPLDAMKMMDFIFVQFYNNPVCNVGSPGFIDSLKGWSSDLGSGPKLYVGMPGCSECAGSGYQDAGAMASTLASVKSAGISNFGGVSLWDGPMSLANGDYTGGVKKALS